LYRLRGNCVWRVPLLPDGTPYKVGVFIQISGEPGPRVVNIR